jgi:hypothetical protein
MKKFKIKTYLLPVILIFAIVILQYVVNRKYTFSEPHPFRGKYLYNPYKGIDSTKWEKGNFHAHTRIFFGITDGSANSGQVLDSFYKYFDYNIIGISNYQKIEKPAESSEWFIPVYEHGYQYYKNHQLVINAQTVSWLDFVFRQTLNNKQSVIDHLKKDTSVIVTIVHPGRRQAYTFNDFKYLNNYDCIEIVSGRDRSISFYDTILSAGHPIFIMANDDSHDLSRIHDGCQSFNMINTDLVRDSILRSLKTGRSVGVNLNTEAYKTDEEKRSGLLRLPVITGVNVKNDTLTVSLNKPVKSISFIGQEGVEKMKVTHASLGSYFFGEKDTYIRTEIECEDGSIYFLNPVFRYDGFQLTDHFYKLDLFKTWLWRTVVISVLFLIFFIIRIKK